MMKKITAATMALLLLYSALFAQQNSEKQMDKMWGEIKSKDKPDPHPNALWFKDAKYAMFIHWGLFSASANRCNGKTYYGIGEWLMKLAAINIKDYEKLTVDFNPVKFDARAWVKLAKDAGMKYIVMTAKHHDGFAMFKSANPYNVVDATPFKLDPLKELAQACHEAGIKLGFYYSQFQDWHEINNWSTDLKKISFEEYFNNKCLPQVNELTSNYGPLILFWFDTPIDMTKEQSLALVNLVKKNQPRALINSRIGNGVGDYSTYGDHEIPASNVPGLWEAVNTSNDSWGHAWYDENWKGPTEIASDLVSVVARGGNFMLNIGPEADGTVSGDNTAFLRSAGNWVKRHSSAIYGSGPSPWLNALPWGDCTITGKMLHFFVFNWQPGGKLWLPGLKTKISAVTMQGSNEPLRFNQDINGWSAIQLPMRSKKELIEVIDVELTGAPRIDATLGVDPVYPTTILADFAQLNGCIKDKASWMEKFGEWKHQSVISGWSSTESSATWIVNVKKPGKYFVNLSYNAWKNSDGNEWDIVVKSDRLRCYATGTTGDNYQESVRFRFRNVRMGVIEFKTAGKQTLELKTASKPLGDGMQLHALYLNPVE